MISIVANAYHRSTSYWRRLKLEVDLEVIEKPEGYLLIGNVPGMFEDCFRSHFLGMEEEDIKVQVTPDPKLVVKGFRGPTDRDLEIMNRVLDSKFAFKTEEERLIVCDMTCFKTNSPRPCLSLV